MQRKFTDMMGRTVTIAYPPKRIVSLVPSQTELLYDLGMNDSVVGITKFCVHPEAWFRTKTRIGGTKQVHIDKVLALQPDLVIANKEENKQEQIEQLAQRVPVWISDIQTLEDALVMIDCIGELTGTDAKANSMVADIANGFSLLQKANEPKRVAYFIWRNPWMCAGGDTFISHMIEAAGWQNVFADTPRYPEVNLETLTQQHPQLVLLSSEPYPFKEQHIAELQAVVPNAKIVLVDGELFSWYGSRLLQSIPYIAQLARTY